MVDDPEVLEDDPEVPTKERNRLVGQPCNVTTAEEHAAFVDPQLTVNELEERALAGAARPGDEHELAALDREIDPA